jgi:hypothetical protein
MSDTPNPTPETERVVVVRLSWSRVKVRIVSVQMACLKALEAMALLLKTAAVTVVLSTTFVALVWLLLWRVLHIVENPAGWSKLSQYERFVYPFRVLDFFRRVEVLGVLTSLGTTGYLYVLCMERGWVDELPSRKRKVLLYLFPVVLTAMTSFACIVTVGHTVEHLAAITSFFGVFVVWDLFMWMGKKANPGGATAREMETMTQRWLAYVDIPVPTTFWILYYVSRNIELKDAFLGGAIGAVLLGQAYHWALDCAHLRALDKEQRS